MEKYRTLFAHHIEDKLFDKVRRRVNRGVVIGLDRFNEEIEQLK